MDPLTITILTGGGTAGLILALAYAVKSLREQLDVKDKVIAEKDAEIKFLNEAWRKEKTEIESSVRADQRELVLATKGLADLVEVLDEQAKVLSRVLQLDSDAPPASRRFR